MIEWLFFVLGGVIGAILAHTITGYKYEHLIHTSYKPMVPMNHGYQDTSGVIRGETVTKSKGKGEDSVFGNRATQHQPGRALPSLTKGGPDSHV